MAISRVTQGMMMTRSLTSLQISMGRLAKTQEQLSTGKLINRPSDSPTGTVSAMRLRTSMGDQAQFQANAEDGGAWLGAIDTSLSSALDSLNLARDSALQGINGASNQQARDALAAQVDEVRASLLATANTTHLGRPVFGGITSGSTAYDEDGAFVGVSGQVTRTVADGVRVAVNVDGPAVFGSGDDSIFAVLDDLATALRSGDVSSMSGSLGGLETSLEQVTAALADVGTRAARLENAVQAAKDITVAHKASLSEIEDVDLPQATVDLQMQQVAYQASLAATAKVIQPSLVDFLR